MIAGSPAPVDPAVVQTLPPGAAAPDAVQAAPAAGEPVPATQPTVTTGNGPITVYLPGGIQQPKPGFFAGAGRQIGADWQLNTELGAVVSALLNADSDDPTTTINKLSDTELWNSLTDDEKATPEFFADVLTARDLAERRAALRRRDELEDQVGDGPLPAILASIIAQFGSPINYIPIAGVGSKAVTGARTGLAAFGRSAALVGGSSIALTAAQETFIHQVQAGRTLGESLTAMAMSGLIGSGLGGPLGVLARRGAIRRAEVDAFDAAAVDAFDAALAAEIEPPAAARVKGNIVTLADEAPPPGRVVDDLANKPLVPDAYDEAVAAGRGLSEAERIALAQRADEGGFFTTEELGRMEGAKQTFDGELAGVRAKIAEVEASIENLTRLREEATDRGPRQSYGQRLRRKREELEALAARELDLSEIRRALDDAANGGLRLVRATAREMADTINRTVEEPRPVRNSAQIADDLAYLEELVAASERRLEGRTETLGAGPRRPPPPRNLGEVEAQAMDVNQPAELEMQGTARSLSAGAAPRFVGSTDMKYDPADTRLFARNMLSRLALAIYKKGQGRFKTIGEAASVIPRLSNLGVANPGITLAGSRWASTREYAMRMAAIGLEFVGPNAGRAFQNHVPVEMLIRSRVDPMVHRARALVDTGYRSYLRDVKAFNKQAKMAGQPTRPVLTPNEFSAAVSEAVSRADLDPTNPQRSKHISMVAKQVHDQYFRPLFDELTNAGLLKDLPPDASVGYLMRVWDTAAIQSHLPIFREKIGDYIRKAPGANAYTQAELSKIVSDTVNNIISPMTDIGFPRYRIVAERGPLATRELHIPNEAVDRVAVPDDKGGHKIVSFINNDIRYLLERYIRTAVADLAMTKEFGSPNPMDDILKKMSDEAQRDIASRRAAGELTEAQARALGRELEHEKAAMLTVYERVRGTSSIPIDPTYDVPRRILHQLRNMTVLRLMGLGATAQLPDTGRMVMQQGVSRVYGDLFREMQTAFRGVRANVKDLRQANVGTDIILATTARRITDAGTNMHSRTMIERAGDRGVELMYLWNGMNHMNAATKTFSGFGAIQEILESADLVSRGAALDPKTQVRLARMGISTEDLSRIAEQRDPNRWRVGRGEPDPEFGWFQTPEGAYVGGLDTWPDRELAERVGQRLLMLTDDTIITPGAADTPRFFDTWWGRMFGTLKRFMFAAAGRTTLVGLQRQDADALLGMTQMLAFGALSLYLRYALTNRLAELEKMDTNEFILNSIDRSGIVPLFFEADNAIGSIVGTYAQPTRLMTGAAPLRTSEAAMAKYVAGAPGSYLIDAAQTAKYIADKDWEVAANDWWRMIRLMPGNNLVWWAWLLETQRPER
jgi:hypothetical protein